MQDDRHLLWVDLQQLAPHPNADVDRALGALWQQILANGYEGAPPALVQRRTVGTGARASFARATVRRVGNPDDVMVSLYLVEADSLVVPFFVVQGCDTNEPGAAMIITYSFPKTHALVEAALGAVAGRPDWAPAR